jgi:TetR/AcrR family transcriptional repressor of mexJK operon
MAPGTRKSNPLEGDMKNLEARPDRRSRKVEQILVAACDLFLEHGFDAVTMDMVTRVSGVSKATLYVHFANKEALFEAVLTDEAKRVTDTIWLSDVEVDDVPTALNRVARNFIDIFTASRCVQLWRAAIGAVPRFPGIGRVVFEAGPVVLTERLARFFTLADEKALLDVPNPTLAARQFLSIVRGDIDVRGMLSLELPPKAEIEEQIEEGIALFLAHYERRDGMSRRS